MAQWTPGMLVFARNRHWVVLPSDNPDLLLLRPLGGTETETCGIYLPVEGPDAVRPTRFPPPAIDRVADFADAAAARLLWNAARLTLRDGAGPFRSLGRLSFRPRAYQYVPLLMALRLNPVRLFIADDVGVGKTIEALLIARELWDRGEIRRLCVLCPPYLCEQWEQELREKFHLEAVVIRSGTVPRLERQVPAGRSLFEHFPVFVASIDYVKSERYRDSFLTHCPEVVIVDEVHGAARPPGRRRAQQQRHELLKRIAADPNRHLILLTATPHSGIEDSFRSLLGLLRPEFETYEFSHLTEQQRKELARHYVQRRRADVQKWMEESTPFPKRIIEEASYTLSSQYRALFQDIYRFAQRLVKFADKLSGRSRRLCYWSALALLRCVMSSPAAAQRTLGARLGSALHEVPTDDTETFDPTVYDLDDRDVLTDVEPSASVEEAESTLELLSQYERRQLRAFAKRAQELAFTPDDTKLTKLIEIVRRLLSEGFHPIVWCRYIATAEYIAEGLRRALRETHPDAVVMDVTGMLPEDERIDRVRRLAQSHRRVLVATDCLSEGVNLQDSFTAVVHYDLPWNPNRLEQREGRVDRFGQQAPTVKAITLYGRDNPVDGIVLDVLIRKAREVYRSTGVMLPIPESSETVVEAVLQALLLKAADMVSTSHQPLLEFIDLPMIRNIHYAWERSALMEKESRTRFAQRAIKPEEVQREVEETDRVLGDPDAVRRFVLDACQRLRIPFRKEAGDDVWSIELSAMPPVLRERLEQLVKTDTTWRLTFTSPPPEHVRYVGRNDPFVTALASYLLEQALSGAPEAPASRAGVMATRAVSLVTTVFLLQVRYVLEERGKVPLLAEEAYLCGVRGFLPNVTLLGPDEVLQLLDAAQPIRNVPPAERKEWLKAGLDLWEQCGDIVQTLLKERAQRLRDAHRRVRRLLHEPAITVRPQQYPDLLGLYVFIPR